MLSAGQKEGITLFHLFSSVSTDCKSNGRSVSSDNVEAEIHSMSVPAFINNLGDYEQMNHDATHVLENVRGTVVKRVGKLVTIVCV